MPFLGAHESVSGGLHLAFQRIELVGGQSLQIFTRNQRQWRHKPLVSEEIEQSRQTRKRYPEMIVASHGSYLINLAAADRELRRKSIDAFAEELRRCELLELPYVVLHPGSHGGDGIESGLARFVSALDEALAAAASSSTMVLVETTAGQGTGLGGTFEELAVIRRQSANSGRIGVCFDTCHVFAVGYDFRDEGSYRAMMDEFDRLVGLRHLHLFHLNDSKKPLGGRVDRHEHIGAGHIGREGFRLLLNDPRFAAHAMLLETPKSEDLQEDIDNLAMLCSLLDR